MPKILLKKESFLSEFSKTINNVSIKEVLDHRITSLAVPLGCDRKCNAIIKKVFKKTIPQIEKSIIVSNNNFLFRLASDMLFFCENSTKKAPKTTIDLLKQNFYTTDQSGGWCCLQASGSRVIEMLERICPLDLSKENFKILDAKRTTMEHLGVIIFKRGETEFLLYSASSSAKSFLHAVETSCKNL